MAFILEITFNNGNNVTIIMNLSVDITFIPKIMEY